MQLPSLRVRTKCRGGLNRSIFKCRITPNRVAPLLEAAKNRPTPAPSRWTATNRTRNNLRKSPARGRPPGVRMTRTGMTPPVPAAVAGSSPTRAAVQGEAAARMFNIPAVPASLRVLESRDPAVPAKEADPTGIREVLRARQTMHAGAKTPAIDCGGLCVWRRRVF